MAVDLKHTEQLYSRTEYTMITMTTTVYSKLTQSVADYKK